MSRIVLKEIIKVYRFAVRARSWEREKEGTSHFLAYRLNGTTLHEINGKVYTFTKDTLMVANAEDRYRVLSHEMESEGTKGGSIAIHFSTVDPFALHLTTFDCSDQPQVRSLFFKMLDAWKQYRTTRSPAAEYAVTACFYAILSQMYALAERAEDHTVEKIAKAKDFIDRNYHDSRLSVADVSSVVGVSERRLGEMFRNRYHQTPGKYLSSCRIDAALSLLKQPRLSIAEVAALSGFASASYFIKMFKREMGMPPGRYRRQGYNG